MTSKVKGQGRKVRSQGHVMSVTVVFDKLRIKRLKNTKIGRKVVHPTGNNAYQF